MEESGEVEGEKRGREEGRGRKAGKGIEELEDEERCEEDRQGKKKEEKNIDSESIRSEDGEEGGGGKEASETR